MKDLYFREDFLVRENTEARNNLLKQSFSNDNYIKSVFHYKEKMECDCS